MQESSSNQFKESPRKGRNFLNKLRNFFRGGDKDFFESTEETNSHPNFLSMPREMIPQSEIKIPEGFKLLLEELAGRRAGYEMFPLQQERREVVAICNNLVEYLHANQISNLALIDRSARPVYIGVRKLWKKKYPEDQAPSIYFFNPTGFVNQSEAFTLGSSGFPRAIEITAVAQQSQDEVGTVFDFLEKSPELIEQNFESVFKRLMKEKDKPLLVFDNCIHEGKASKPILAALKSWGFSEIKFGVSSNDRNFTDITPDLICLSETPLGICYPFHPDKLVDKQIKSVVSSPTFDQSRRAEAYKVRSELEKIFDEAPPSWYS